MDSRPLFCRGCKHLKSYCSMNNPAAFYWYCDLEKCEIENKEEGRKTDGSLHQHEDADKL